MIFQGLRVIKAVMDIRGAKRFKDLQSNGGADTLSVNSFNINDPIFDATAAQEKFRKKQNQTSYRYQFGEPPKAAEDFVVIRQKKLRDLEISTYLKPEAISYLEKWLGFNNSDEFVKRVYFTIREIHTCVKNQEAPIANNNHFFKGTMAEKAPRFDQIITNAMT